MTRCPQCFEYASKVLDTRTKDNGWLRRKRQCDCGHRWFTLEIPESDVTETKEDDE